MSRTTAGSTGLHAAAGHGRDGRRAHVRDGRQPHHRPPHRRPQPAHRPARAGHRRASACAPRGPARWSRSSCSSARPPLLNSLCLAARPARRRPAGRLPVRQALHRLPAGRARRSLRWSPGRRLARRHRRPSRLRRRPGSSGSRSARGSAASTSSTPARTPTVDREIGVHSRPGALRHPVRAARVDRRPRRDVRRCSSGSAQLAGLGWLWWIGLAAHGGRVRLRARHRPPDDLSRVNRAFFTANGFVGIALFVFALLDLTILGGLRP